MEIPFGKKEWKSHLENCLIIFSKSRIRNSLKDIFQHCPIATDPSNNVLLGRIEGPVWYTIYHQLPVVIRGKQTPLFSSTNQWEKDINDFHVLITKRQMLVNILEPWNNMEHVREPCVFTDEQNSFGSCSLPSKIRLKPFGTCQCFLWVCLKLGYL